MFALNLNSQLSALTAITQQKTAGNDDQSAKIASEAKKFLADFEEASAEGGSIERLEKKAAQWVNDAIEDIAKGAPVEASTESVFAALTAGTEQDGASLDLVGQLSVISDINADQIFGDEALAGELANKATEFLTKINDKIADGKSTAKVEKAAAEWIAEAVEDIAFELAAMTVAEDVFAAAAKTPAGADADAGAAAGAPAAAVQNPAATVATPAETRGASAKSGDASAEKNKSGPAEAQKNGGAASGASASNAPHKTDAGATGVEASGKAASRVTGQATATDSLAGKVVSAAAEEVADGGAAESTNERLEAMKRALAKLSAISSGETASQLSSLVKKADAQDDASGAVGLKASSATMSDGGQQSFLAAASAYSMARSGWVAQ